MRSLRSLLFALAIAMQAACIQARPPSYQTLAGLIKADHTQQFKQALAQHQREDIDPAGRAALMGVAVANAKPAAVEILMDWGIPPDTTLPFRQQGEAYEVTPLLYAISARAGLPTVKVLVQRGANPNQPAAGLLPLNFALSLRQYDVAAYLLDAGANSKATDETSRTTPLMELATTADDAATEPNAIAQRLLRAGADPNARGVHGVTALRLAVLGGKPRLVQTLLAAGADPNTTNDKGESVLQLARRKQFGDIVALLQSSGAKP